MPTLQARTQELDARESTIKGEIASLNEVDERVERLKWIKAGTEGYMQRRRHDNTRGVRFANSYTHFDVGDEEIDAAVEAVSRLVVHALEL